MKQRAYLPRLVELTIGQVVTAVGIVFMMQANLGLEPWSVLQQGLNRTFGITFGTAVVVVSTSIIILDLLLGERIGLGMVFSAVLCGPIIDFISARNWIAQQTKLLPGLVFLFLGLELLAFGTYLSMRVGLGCGARDALMVAMAKRTGITVGICRVASELAATLIGWLMGGQVGIGTVLSAAGIGTLIEVNFRLFRYHAVDEKHEYLSDTVRNLFSHR